MFKSYLAIIFCISLIPAVVNGSSPAKAEKAASVHNPFVGTWELVSGRYLIGEGADKKWVMSKQSSIRSIKVINATHFSYTSLSGEKFWGSGTGRYSFTETEYSETPEYVSYPMEKGKVYTFTYEFKTPSSWTNTRVEDGELVEEEVWRRVK